MRYWLFKSEPSTWSWDMQKARGEAGEEWDGVRNYQARNFMRSMKVGDRVLFYHSNANPPAVAGTAVVCREAYPDFTQFDPKQKHYDPDSSHDDPRWDMVDIRLESVFDVPVPLDVLRGRKDLEGMELLRRGSRLSVQPVSREHFEIVLSIAKALAADPAAASASANATQPKRKAAKRAAAKPAAAKKAAAKKTAVRKTAKRAAKKATKKRGTK